MGAERALPRGWLWLPPALLLAVAGVQVGLAKTQQLSPWLGGGFGMFASTDDRSHRHLHLLEERPGVVRALALPQALHGRARRVLAYPSERRLRALARDVAAAVDLRPDATLRVEVWQTRYQPRSLSPWSEVLRALRLEPDRGREP